MEAIKSVDYLTKLPEELKLKIFSYLSSVDLIQLTKIPEISRFSSDRKLISSISFYREYRLEIQDCRRFLSSKLRSHLITSLNINYVFWIEAFQLRRSLRKLNNLQHLYAVGTKLSLKIRDCKVYSSLQHLKTIATTYGVSNNLQHFPLRIVNLYLHLEHCTSRLVQLISGLTNLEELWLIQTVKCGRRCQYLHMVCDFFAVVSSIKNVRVIFEIGHDPNFINLFTSIICGLQGFKIYRAGTQICLEKNLEFNKKICVPWKFKDPSWNLLINKFKVEPFNIETRKKLMLGQSPEQLPYEELNMASYKCSANRESTLETLLLSANMRGLKKLCINMCLGKQESNTRATQESPWLGPSSSLPGESTLEKIVRNSPLIEELELCFSTCFLSSIEWSKITNSALGSIQYLVNLRRLTFQDIPMHLSGEFLVDICKGCRQLESLHIESKHENDNLDHYVSLALCHAKTLKDFRYCQPYSNVNRIIESITTLKLERVVLLFEYRGTVAMALLEPFLLNNPQLRFIYMCICRIPSPNTEFENIAKTLKEYQGCPQKVFVMGTDGPDRLERMSLPFNHHLEMIERQSDICRVDILNGFTK